jgi:hypothetical protein
VDVASVYTLTPPAGPAVVFNAESIFNGGLTDVFWLTDIKGLDSAQLRTPQFLRPRAHGGYKPVPWLEHPLHPRFEGAFVIRSKPIGADCRAERNTMYHALKNALRACEDAVGTLEWNEPGIGDLALEVSYEVELTHGFDAGFTVMTFQFGLYSEASQPVAA